MPISKVLYGNTSIVDLTADTVAPNKMLPGVTAKDAAGVTIVGNMETDMPTKTIYVNYIEPTDSLGLDGDVYIEMG